MLGGDERLQEVRRRRGGHERAEQVEGLQRLVVVPAGAVLVGQQHQLAVHHAGVPPGVQEDHQGEQRVQLGAVDPRRQDGTEHPHEPHRLARRAGAEHVGSAPGGVAGGEREVGDVADDTRALRQPGRVGEGERRPGQLLAGAGEPRGHRRSRDQEEPSDVLGPYAEDEPQRQCGGRLGRQPGVGAEQHQPQPFVGEHLASVRHHPLGLLGGVRVDDEQRQLRGVRRLRPQPVEDLAAGGGQQPRGRVVRDAVGRPAPGRGLERVGQPVLGEVEPSEPGDEQGQEPAPLVTVEPAQRLGGARHPSASRQPAVRRAARRPGARRRWCRCRPGRRRPRAGRRGRRSARSSSRPPARRPRRTVRR